MLVLIFFCHLSPARSVSGTSLNLFGGNWAVRMTDAQVPFNQYRLCLFWSTHVTCTSSLCEKCLYSPLAAHQQCYPVIGCHGPSRSSSIRPGESCCGEVVGPPPSRTVFHFAHTSCCKPFVSAVFLFSVPRSPLSRRVYSACLCCVNP